MKYLEEKAPGEWWESDDQRHWKRVIDRQTLQLLLAGSNFMAVAFNRILNDNASGRIKRIPVIPEDPITDQHIRDLEMALSSIPTAKNVEEDKQIGN